MTVTDLAPGAMDRHLRLMRLTTLVFLATIPVAASIVILVSDRRTWAPPLAISLVAAAAALWVGFTANRDAGARIDRIKRAFAVHGDEQRLLADHRLVNLAVLARLEVMVAAAVVAGVWGSLAAVPWGLLVLATTMIVLSWPTADKSHTLLARARDRRSA
ncbi:MAG: hypothetical protein PVG53_01690 [Holophagae bacterium]|jgi:hypothetical protein